MHGDNAAVELSRIGFSLFSFDFCRTSKNSKADRLKPVPHKSIPN
jgi:hypothetical protein